MPVTNPFRAAGIVAMLTLMALLAVAVFNAAPAAAACAGANKQSQAQSKAKANRAIFCASRSCIGSARAPRQ